MSAVGKCRRAPADMRDLVHRPSKFMADDNFAKLQRLRDIYDPDRRFFDFYAPAGTTINSFEPR